MSGCIEATAAPPAGCGGGGGAGGRKGPIPAVAIKETCQENVVNGDGHVTNGCINDDDSGLSLNSLRLSEDGHQHQEEESAKSRTTKEGSSCCSGSSDSTIKQKRQGEKVTSCDQTTSTSEIARSAAPSSSSSLPSTTGGDAGAGADSGGGVTYQIYQNELNMPDIMRLIQKDLSEPYSIYTYRYFIHNWPNLCFMARVDDECVGAIVCKLDYHKKVVKRGYIAMLAVDSKFRKRAIGSTLVQKAIEAMNAQEADEVVLETEITNRPALRLYENLGFVRDKRLFRYYLNGVDALRLKLWLRWDTIA